MSERDVAPYWQAYVDLLENHATGFWDDAQTMAHWRRAGEAEGRVFADPSDIPEDWSDWLYFSEWTDEFAWWWKAGVLPTGAYASMACRPPSLEVGRISLNRGLGGRASMPPEARAQLVAHARAFPGSGPLREIRAEPLRWSGGEDRAHLLPLQDLLAERFPGGVDHVAILPALRIGGAERVGVWHHVAAETLGLRSAILTTDDAVVAPQFEEHRASLVNLPEIYAEALGAEFTAMPIEARTEAVIGALETLSPSLAHLIHSYIGYMTFTQPGTADRARAAVGRLHVSGFCAHIHRNGVHDGYFRYVPELRHHVDRFVFDNSWYRDEVAARFGLPEDRLAVLHYPVPEADPLDPAATADSNKVLWAARLDSQKNPQIVGRIAERMPHLEFLVHGAPVMNDEAVDWSAMPGNVRRCGPFAGAEELPFGEVFAFLYTSRFDGMPLILMDAGARGVPVVSPRVGGIPDFLGPDWVCYVEDPEDVEGYVACLTMLHRSMDLRRFASERLTELVRDGRSVGRFLEAVRPLMPAPRAADGTGGEDGE